MIYLRWFVYFSLATFFSFIFFLFFSAFLNIKIKYWVAVLIQSLIIILAGKWYFKLRLDNIKNFLFKDLKKENWREIFKTAFFILIAVYLVKGIIYLYLYYFENFKVEEKNYLYEFEYLYSELNFFIFWITLSLFGPLSEELLYRKGLFEVLSKKCNFAFSAIISSLIFSLIHTTGSSFINGFICGLFLAFLYKKTNSSLLAVFATHSIYNIFNFVIALVFYIN